jgi:hypothetical protein
LRFPFFVPNRSSMATRDDHGDVVCLGGPTEFLYACLNSGQEFIYRRVPISSDKLGEAHFAVLFRLSIRCSVIPSVQITRRSLGTALLPRWSFPTFETIPPRSLCSSSVVWTVATQNQGGDMATVGEPKTPPGVAIHAKEHSGVGFARSVFIEETIHGLQKSRPCRKQD